MVNANHRNALGHKEAIKIAKKQHTERTGSGTWLAARSRWCEYKHHLIKRKEKNKQKYMVNKEYKLYDAKGLLTKSKSKKAINRTMQELEPNGGWWVVVVTVGGAIVGAIIKFL